MNKQRKVLITITYNEMGIIIDTKAEKVEQPEKRTEEHTETHGVCLDAISRQAAIDAVQNRPMMLSKEKVLLINDLEKLPPAEPKRIRGRWIYSSYDDESGFDESWTCDKCGYSTNIEETNYCPKCGADMREVTE